MLLYVEVSLFYFLNIGRDGLTFTEIEMEGCDDSGGDAGASGAKVMVMRVGRGGGEPDSSRVWWYSRDGDAT